MAPLIPSMETLQGTIYTPMAMRTRQTGPTRYQARPELYGAFSVVDDTKEKAQKLSAEAAKEFEKASATAQAKTGNIEMYTPKYYAACTFGGLLACVSYFVVPNLPRAILW